MDSRAGTQLMLPLARPARGGSTRVRFAGSEVVLEATRGGYSVLWLDGRESRRFAIGLPAGGEVLLTLAAPRLPVRVVTRETLTLAPGGRLRGYVQVPLVPTLLWRTARAEPQRLAEFARDELAAEWDDRDGTIHRCTSPFHVRFPVPTNEARAIVPVWLANPTAQVASPGHLPIDLRDDELSALRASTVAPPRRLRWNGQVLEPAALRRKAVAL